MFVNWGGWGYNHFTYGHGLHLSLINPLLSVPWTTLNMFKIHDFEHEDRRTAEGTGTGNIPNCINLPLTEGLFC